ncbi:MAG: hypothetical protein HZB13_13295 [Acidobacteria bacterium]|nr:hypothetical protein [Acidobacteriota bacterium]
MMEFDTIHYSKCPMCGMASSAAAGACSICGASGLAPWPAGAELPLDQRLTASGRLADAYALLQDQVSRVQQDAPSCVRLAWLAYAFEDMRAVEIWCHEASRLDGDSAEPHMLLGLEFQRSARWPEALEEYGAALRKPGLSTERHELLTRLSAECRGQMPEW